MTELRSTAQLEAAASGSDAKRPRRAIMQGLVGLGLGAGLTVLAVSLAQGTLGFLGLVVVLASLGWISVGVMRTYAARFRRS